MKRLFLAAVPGNLFCVAWYALLALIDFSPVDGTVGVFGVVYGSLMAVLSVLNLYSWDYQRRARAGGVS